MITAGQAACIRSEVYLKWRNSVQLKSSLSEATVLVFSGLNSWYS